MNILDSNLCRSCTQSDCVRFNCISQACSQSQYTNLHLKEHCSWLIICSTPRSMQTLLYQGVKAEEKCMRLSLFRKLKQLETQPGQMALISYPGHSGILHM